MDSKLKLYIIYINDRSYVTECKVIRITFKVVIFCSSFLFLSEMFDANKISELKKFIR